MIRQVEEITTKLKSLYNVLDLMNNNIISKENKKQVQKDIKKLLKLLQGLNI